MFKILNLRDCGKIQGLIVKKVGIDIFELWVGKRDQFLKYRIFWAEAKLHPKKNVENLLAQLVAENT